MSDVPGPVLAPARIRYQGDQPYSLDFADIYHAADGAAEVARVFVAPCHLDELAAERRGGGVVRVGELGFGSGLNFVIAAERCLAAGARLHFVSCEAHPIDGADFRTIARRRAAAHALYAELAAGYPPRIRGWHRRSLAGGRVLLSLWLGDAEDALADLSGRQHQPLDAWFLDGFAPDRNPALWHEGLFRAMAGLSRRGTRVATFTAAGRVRRGLQDAGFAMARVDQRPHKRESLAGTFTREGLSGFAPPRGALVVGGGLAGASAARHLAEAGCEVMVADAGAAPDAPPASALPVTVLHARLLGDDSAAAALRYQSYLYAVAWVKGHAGFHPSGALQLAGDAPSEARLEALAGRYGAAGPWLHWLDAAAAADLAGWPVTTGGLHFPDAGIVELPRLVQSLLDHPHIETRRAHVTELPDDVPVVLAAGSGVRAFSAADYLEVAPVQGQLDVLDMDPAPRLPLVGSRYLVPLHGGAAAGSTYEHRPWETAEATRANLRQLEGHRYTWRERHRGTRTVASDRTAIAGPLYAADGTPLPERYVSTGHGSAGNVSAHLAGAVLTAWITGDCPPLARAVEAALSPWRFHARQARRGRWPAHG